MTFISPSSRKFPVLPLSATALVVLGGGLAGLLLLLHPAQQQTASSAQTDTLGLTIFMAALGAVAGGYLASIVICAFKGKSRFALFGCVGFLAPAAGYSPGWGLIVLVIVGAIRLAKPTSRWAQSYYGEDKTRAAILRFPQCYTFMRNDSALPIEISRDPSGGSSYLIQPGRHVIFLGDLSVIGFVIRTTGRALHYSPLTFQGQETSHKGRQKYSYAFTGEHTIYSLGADGLLIRDAQGFPVTPRAPKPQQHSSEQIPQTSPIPKGPEGGLV